MQIITYLEHNNERFVVGDHVILNSYNKPELSGTIDSISKDELRPGFSVIPDDDGGLVLLKLDEIENIRKISKVAKAASEHEAESMLIIKTTIRSLTAYPITKNNIQYVLDLRRDVNYSGYDIWRARLFLYSPHKKINIFHSIKGKMVYNREIESLEINGKMQNMIAWSVEDSVENIKALAGAILEDYENRLKKFRTVQKREHIINWDGILDEK